MHPILRLLRALSPLALLTSAAAAQTVTVTTAADVVDIAWQTATIADLPGPDGRVSFSEAMIATNHTPGHQTVAFNIPQSEWTLQFLLPGRAVLTSTVGFFFVADETVTIDGTTQTAFTGDTNPDGHEVAIYGTDLRLNGDNCTLIGFDSTSVSVNGSFGQVLGNTGTMNISLFGGASSLIQGNTGGTIKIDRSNDNVVVGNTVSRVRVLGWVGGGLPATNNRIGGPNAADRNFITGYGTTNSDGYPSGTTVQLFDTIGTVVENNRIGTTPDGLAQGNLFSTVGVGFEGENHDVLVRDNLISGILGHGQGPHAAGLLFGWGILVSGTGSDIDVLGNVIGPDANGLPTLGSVWGISVGDAVTHPSGVTGLRIGGAGPGEGNVVAGHRLNGITIGRTAPPVRIQGNSIHSNTWLGIDLIPTASGYGVSPNDPLDADTGGNGLQNFPELTGAELLGGTLRVTGSLHSSPSGVFTVELFSSAVCDDSGFGEGATPLGTFAVATDASGDASFDVTLPMTAALGGEFLSATATDESTGATSEFAACLPIVDVEVGQAFCFGDGSGLACPCGNTGAPGRGCGSAGDPGGARLLAGGSASVAADDLFLSVDGSSPSKPGLFFQGTSALNGGLGVLFADGLRCAGGPLVRLEVVVASASGVAESSVSIAGQGGVAAGQTRFYQWWYRDAQPSPCGNSANTSNGVSLTWMP